MHPAIPVGVFGVTGSSLQDVEGKVLDGADVGWYPSPGIESVADGAGCGRNWGCINGWGGRVGNVTSSVGVCGTSPAMPPNTTANIIRIIGVTVPLEDE